MEQPKGATGRQKDIWVLKGMWGDVLSAQAYIDGQQRSIYPLGGIRNDQKNINSPEYVLLSAWPCSRMTAT